MTVAALGLTRLLGGDALMDTPKCDVNDFGNPHPLV